MSCLCIGGVCIPYTALLPMLLIGLQWIANQLARIGILPEWIVKRLGGLLSATATTTADQNKKQERGCDTIHNTNGCCGGGDGGSRRHRRGKRSDTVATSSSSSSFSSTFNTNTDNDQGGNANVEHVTDLARYQEIIRSDRIILSNNNSNNNTATLIIVKFTADWCKPCKLIQPIYRSLAATHYCTASDTKRTGTTTGAATATTFITVDVDGDGCDALCTQYKIIMMPTFICLRMKNNMNGKDVVEEVGRMTGGGEENGKKLCDWVHEMMMVG